MSGLEVILSAAVIILILFVAIAGSVEQEARKELEKARETISKYSTDYFIAANKADNLLRGIKKHSEAKGHDRCWLNDLELYELAGLKIDKIELGLPDLPEFIGNCCAYWRDRQPPEARKLGG